MTGVTTRGPWLAPDPGGRLPALPDEGPLYLRQIRADQLPAVAARFGGRIAGLQMVNARGPGGWVDVDDAALAPLRDLPRLRILELGACGEVTDAALEGLSGLRHLSRLDLSLTEVRGPGLAALAGGNLRSLDLSRIQHPLSASDAAALSGLTSLERLELGRRSVEPGAIEALSGLPKLRDLWLSGLDAPRGALAELQSLRQLRGLTLSKPSTARRQLRAPQTEALASLSGLARLDLEETQLGDGALAALAGLEGLRALRCVGDGGAGDDGVAPFGGHPRLQILALRAERASDRALEALAGGGLRCLHLHHSEITPAGLRSFGGGLREIGFNGVPGGQGWVDAIAALPEIVRVQGGRAGLKGPQRQALKALRPGMLVGADRRDRPWTTLEWVVGAGLRYAEG